VLKFLSGLSPTLRSQVRDQILGEDNIPTLTATFSRVMCVSTDTDVSHASSIDQSAMYYGRSRGHGRGCERDSGGGRGSFGMRRNFPGR